ncbi:YbgC/FadM family acyl-CoA thioesterase [Candidatus Pelagibacter sp. HIMB1746]|uniref:YbgC/FadM family acyl-CoA thioesterase n=1 Tax=Candidatus Pelagibacter sp. HIMB1746 TaxID=3413370 RepID=UPI003F84F60A
MHKTFSHNVKIYYEDTDSGGVVYYANYLKYLERARTEALLTIGLSNLKIKEEFNSLIIVKSCNIEYKKSAYLEDNLTIKSFISSLSKTSFVMDQSIYRDDLLIVDAKIHLVFVNTIGKPIKIPEIVLNNFEPYILKN